MIRLRRAVATIMNKKEAEDDAFAQTSDIAWVAVYAIVMILITRLWVNTT
jgi:hypothetical protein